VNHANETVKNYTGEEFRCGVLPRKRWLVIQVSVAQISQDSSQLVSRSPNVNHHSIVVKIGTPKRNIHDIGRTVQPVSWAKYLTTKTVSDHEVVADIQAIHCFELLRPYLWCGISDTVTKRSARFRTKTSQHNGQLREVALARNQNVKLWCT
jgi:hypothetical protein